MRVDRFVWLLATISTACASGARSTREPQSNEVPVAASPPVPDALCRLGVLEEGTRTVDWDELLRAPDHLQGPRIRVRGVSTLAREMMGLIEPKQNGRAIGLDIHRLKAASGEEIVACNHKLVDVEGYVTHVPARGGEQWIIMAEVMTSPPAVGANGKPAQ